MCLTPDERRAYAVNTESWQRLLKTDRKPAKRTQSVRHHLCSLQAGPMALAWYANRVRKETACQDTAETLRHHWVAVLAVARALVQAGAWTLPNWRACYRAKPSRSPLVTNWVNREQAKTRRQS